MVHFRHEVSVVSIGMGPKEFGGNPNLDEFWLLDGPEKFGI